MIDLDSIFTPEQKAALQLLVKSGFEVYTEAKLEDVRELNGTRHRTFRNQGRYDLALMLKHTPATPAKVVEAITEKAPVKAEQPEPEPKVEPKPVAKPVVVKRTKKRSSKK